MTRRRTVVPVVALALLAGSLSVAARPSLAAGVCPDGVFCAGAASGDITPPVTTPMFGYTARHGVLASGAVPAHAAAAAAALSQGNAGGALSAARAITEEQFVRDKTAPDPDRYDKTFVANHGVHHRLLANAFVLRGTDGGKVAVVQVDLGGVPGELHDAVAARLADRGISRDNLLISATHTHGGPGGIFQYQGYALLGGDEFDPRVFEAVASGIAGAVARADDRLTPAKMGWSRAMSSNLNRNRRVSPQWCRNPESKCVNGQPSFASPPSHAGELTVVRLDRLDGVPIGVITTLAAHGTIGGDRNLLFSGDNQGAATRAVVRSIVAESAPLPAGWEVVNALVNGAQGDQSAVGDTVGYDWGPQGQYAAMEEAGIRQAAAVMGRWRALASQMRTDVTVDARFTFVCFCGQEVDDPFVYDGPQIDKSDPAWNRVAPYAALGDGGVVGSDGSSLPFPIPGQGRKRPVAAGLGLAPHITRLQLVRIGDLLLAGLPGEANVTAGRRIEAALLAVPGRAAIYGDVAIAGLANDYVSYFATPEEYTAHQYEGSFTLYGPQSTPLLMQEYVDLALRMVAGTAVPDCSVPASSAEYCATHPMHPDTSMTAAPVTPLGVDLPPRILVQPQRTMARFGIAELVWQGGSPSAEWRLDQSTVSIQQLTGSTWTTVAQDARDDATVLRYDKEDGAHLWTAQWDIARDAAAGTYRFRITGAYGAAPGTRAPYTLESIPFVVAPSAALRVFAVAAGASTVNVSAGYPQPDQSRSFRWRPRLVTAGVATLTVLRGGSPVTLTSAVAPAGTTSFDIEPGDEIVSATVTDSFGNTGAS